MSKKNISITIKEHIAKANVLNNEYPKGTIGAVYKENGIIESKYAEFSNELGIDNPEQIQELFNEKAISNSF